MNRSAPKPRPNPTATVIGWTIFVRGVCVFVCAQRVRACLSRLWFARFVQWVAAQKSQVHIHSTRYWQNRYYSTDTYNCLELIWDWVIYVLFGDSEFRCNSNKNERKITTKITHKTHRHWAQIVFVFIFCLRYVTLIFPALSISLYLTFVAKSELSPMTSDSRRNKWNEKYFSEHENWSTRNGCVFSRESALRSVFALRPHLKSTAMKYTK